MATGTVASGRRRRDGVPPAARYPLVGREEQLPALVAVLTRSRLVTLTGPGGAGKTRMALAVFAGIEDLAPDGFWWVDLAGLPSGELVPEAVARAVGVPESQEYSALDRTADWLGTGGVVLGLDNCEHLTGACADLVDRLLDACPGLRVLATSRQPLGVAGETVWTVSPLTLPPGGEHRSAEAVAASAAGQLFEQRARALVPEFRLDVANATAVARICRRLSGLPLAIELAAARMRVLCVEQVAAGLDDAFRLLVGGVRAGPARHQTLRATLDWSYELLSEPERVVFRRLAVFPGGFDLEAAERVAMAGGGIDEHEVLELLACLIDKSLISVRRSPAAARYRMLSTVRDYGRQQLSAAGEQSAVGGAHLEHFCRFAEQWEPRLAGPDQAMALDRLEAEANNLRLALSFAKEHGDVLPGMRLAAALWRLCCLRGHYREGREWLDWAATADPHGPPELRAKLSRGSGSLAFLQCDYPAALHRLEEALRLYRRLGDPTGVATVLQVLGSVAREQGRYQDAESLHRESLALFDAAGDRLGVAQAHGYLGFLSWLQGQWPAAVEHCGHALREFRSLDDAEGIAWSLISLGTVAQYQGDGATAARLLDDAHDLAVRSTYPEGIAWSLHERGLLALQRREPGAEQLLTDALARHRTLGDRWRTAGVLLDVAAASLRRGSPRQAAALLGAASRIRDEIGTVIAPCEQPGHDAVTGAARAALGDDGFAAAWSRGREERLDDLLAEPAEDSPVGPPPPVAAPPVPRVTEAPPLRIRMLGAATVELGGRTLTAADWAYGKPRELLLLLAGSPGQSKANIGAALWPDLAGPQLRNALHTALRDLRRTLADPGWVVYAEGLYTLDRLRGHWSDVEAFGGCLADAQRAESPDDALTSLQAAIALYGGDFVPDLEAPWAVQRRQELHRAFSTALTGAGQLLAAAGRHAEAAEVFRTAAAHAPLREAPHRELMTCLVRCGEPGLAVQVYRDLAQRLREQLGVAPAAETTALVQSIAGDGAGGAAGVRGAALGAAPPAPPVPAQRSVDRPTGNGPADDARAVPGADVRAPRGTTRLGSLSPREREVLREMAQGRTNAAIASALVITQKAVEKHINSIFAKLGVSYDDELHPRVGAVLSFLAEAGAAPGSSLEA